MGHFIDVLILAFFVFTHGDLEDRIREKSDLIALHPHDHMLYMERGELYLLHEEYLNAKADFSFCLNHSFTNNRVWMGLSKSFFYLQSPDSALVYAEKTLALENEHLIALELKAKILSAIGRHCDAAGTMELLLSVSPNPSPALFLATSDDWSLCGNADGSENAIRTLKEGVDRIGPVGVLQKKLVLLFVRQNRLPDAIEVQTSIIEQSKLKIRSYFERAQLYLKMQAPEKSKADLIEAISLWNELPAHKKNLSSMENMRVDIIALLNELDN